MATTVQLGVQARAFVSKRFAAFAFAQPRFYSSIAPSDSTPHIAVVGGGAAGFYTAARLLAKVPEIRIDIFERLPTPHGLVRYGVAPDHPEVKNCMSKFDEVADDKRVRYFGNMHIGESNTLMLDQIKSAYDGVVLSYGASQDRKLGIPGEDGIEEGNGKSRGGIISAREFVGWYNGLPEAQGLDPDLTSSDKVIVIGHGNVALDCARILLSDIDELAKTDITANAIEALRKSKVRHVEMLGRRGPLQAAFTIKELREMVKLNDVSFICNKELVASECERGADLLKKSRPLKRMMDLLLKNSTSLTDSINSDKSRSFTLSFLKSPQEVVFDGPSLSGYPQAVRFVVNRLEGPPDAAKAVPTDESVDIPCGLALRSIGYASTSLVDAPFDSKRKIVPNIAGRATGEDGDIIPGLYVSGWLKRGPVGVIATTMQDAYHTADAIAMDLQNGNIGGRTNLNTRNMVDNVLSKSGAFSNHVTLDDWRRLEKHEFDLGEKAGKPREKITNVNKMLEIIRSKH